MRSTAWTCATCGTSHEGLAMVVGPNAPDPWVLASDAERSRGELNADMCVLTEDAGTTNYFIRGHIEIPVHDSSDGPFRWSVWVSVSETTMRAQISHWDDPARAGLEPMFAWLCTALRIRVADRTDGGPTPHSRAWRGAVDRARPDLRPCGRC